MSQTLIGIFLDAVGRHRKPDQFMRKGRHGWEAISAERALADVESLALALSELGVAAGDRLLLLSETRYEWPIADLAILGLGAVTVPLYPSLPGPQVRTTLENAGARVAIMSSVGQLAKVHEIAGTLLEQIVHMDEAPATGPEDVSWASLLERGADLRRRENPAVTAAALRDGWFHTGDVGRIDEGYLVITDRLKDLLVTAGGKKVAPQPMEARLKAGKWISEVVLIGDGRPCVVALLVPNFAQLAAEAKARGWPTEGAAARLARPEVRGLFQAEIARVNLDLAPFESIKEFALLERELAQERGELTPTLKVKRRAIVQSFASTIEGLYAGSRVPRSA